MIDRSIIEDWWNDSFAKHLSATSERSGVAVADFKVGGRSSKANPNKEDAEFWRLEGLRQSRAYLEWFRKSGWSIATMPDGKPGIEWEAEVSFGGRPVRLIVDAIYQAADALIVVDYKTGSRTPFGMIQVGLYASAIERAYGIRPQWGAFYMTRKAELSDLVDLSQWSMEFFDYEFAAMNAYMDTGYFPPVVGEHCLTLCSVSDYCQAVGGSKSADYPFAQPTKKGNT